MAPDKINTLSISLSEVWQHYFEAHFHHTQSCDKHVNKTYFGSHFRNFPVCTLLSSPHSHYFHNLWKYVPGGPIFSKIIHCCEVMDISLFLTHASQFIKTIFELNSFIHSLKSPPQKWKIPVHNHSFYFTLAKVMTGSLFSCSATKTFFFISKIAENGKIEKVL